MNILKRWIVWRVEKFGDTAKASHHLTEWGARALAKDFNEVFGHSGLHYEVRRAES